jgi:hypothetical protein
MAKIRPARVAELVEIGWLMCGAAIVKNEDLRLLF